MGLSLLFGNFCLEIVSTFMITGLILFTLANETIISKSFLQHVDKKLQSMMSQN